MALIINFKCCAAAVVYLILQFNINWQDKEITDQINQSMKPLHTPLIVVI